MTYTLTGRYPLGDLTGRDGERLRFVPSTTIVGADNIILPAPVEVVLDSDGSFSTPLVGTDDADYAPSGWVWTCYELMAGGRAPWSFELTADSDLSDLATVATPDEPDLYVPITRTLTAGAGLTGGGTLAANRTFAVGAGTGITVNADDVAVDTSVIATRAYSDASQAAAEATAAAALTAHEADTTSVHGIASTAALVVTTDARLSDDRDPTAHAASHAAAGSDPVTVAESQVTGLTAALAAKADDATTLTAGAGLTGGGDLSANRTLAVGAGTGITVNADDVEVKYGTTAGTAAQGNDSRITGAIQSTLADANSVLYAVTDNTPAALAVGASTIVGRKASGDIAALSVAEVRTLVGTTRCSRPNTDDILVETYDAALGWVTTRYDSGWRDVSSLLVNSWTGTVRLRRTFDALFLVADLNGSSSTNQLFATLPAGFCPTYDTACANSRFGFGQTFSGKLGANGQALSVVQYSGLTYSFAGAISSAVPTSLPGTLISAAPAA